MVHHLRAGSGRPRPHRQSPRPPVYPAAARGDGPWVRGRGPTPSFRPSAMLILSLPLSGTVRRRRLRGRRDRDEPGALMATILPPARGARWLCSVAPWRRSHRRRSGSPRRRGTQAGFRLPARAIIPSAPWAPTRRLVTGSKGSACRQGFVPAVMDVRHDRQALCTDRRLCAKGLARLDGRIARMRVGSRLTRAPTVHASLTRRLIGSGATR